MNMHIIRLAVLTLLTTTSLRAADDYATHAGSDAVTTGARSDTGAVIVNVAGLQSTQGMVYASLFITADGFPDDLDQAFASQAVAATEADKDTLVLTFDDIQAGPFAISIFHDANSDGKLDTNFLGIPKEQYGFSQNPPSRFGPPSFDKAAVELTAGETKQLVITLK